MRNLSIPSKRLVASYIFDWIVIIAIAAVGVGWNSLNPNHRPFSLDDLSISFPYQQNEKIPTWLLLVVSLVAPAIIVFFVCLLFVPGPTASRETSKGLIWRRKFWEWNTGWMGLALSLTTAFLITQGMKNLFGKPRPDLLSRCMPNVDNVDQYAFERFGQGVASTWTLVHSGICTTTDDSELQDGFRSFPSGHASFSWAGLLHLTLFLCSKFAIAIPFLAPRPYSQDPSFTALERKETLSLPMYRSSSTLANQKDGISETSGVIPIRNQAAAPPAYTLVLALIPVCTAIYISSTRFSDFRHHGFDILFGSFIGIVCSYFSFRWYHLPIRQGAGWSWGARSRDRAWGIGVGIHSYVGPEGWAPANKAKQDGDIEANGAEGRNGILSAGLDGQTEEEIAAKENARGSGSSAA